MDKCEICGREFTTVKGFGTHIVQGEKISRKDYYNKYLKKNGEGICLTCGKETKFISLGQGYHKYCNPSCVSRSDYVRKKKEETCEKNYGYLYPMKSKTVQAKREETWIAKYGSEHPVRTKEIQAKARETCKKEFGFEFPSQSDKIKKKARDRCLKKFGHEYCFQSKQVKEKIEETRKQNYKKNKANKLKIFTTRLEQRLKQLNLELLDKYEGADIENKFECRKCGTVFKTTWHSIQQDRYGCPKCYPRDGKNSHLQSQLFRLCQEILPYPVLEYPVSGKFIDIAVPTLNIAIEYDGSYWHQDHYQDMKRQKMLEDEGWTFLRYRDHLTSKSELLSDVNYILETNKSILKSEPR